jgi:hypothetical protein
MTERPPAWRQPYLLVALALAFVFHGSLLFTGTFKRTYDAYVHIFFADHYRRGWFETWEPRWYTGFSVTSYPPGAQQAVALVSHLAGLLNAYAVVQLLAMLLFVLGVFRFSRLWVSDDASGYAAILAVFASSVAETIHVFGQLPTIFALAFLLNALPSLSDWLKTGRAWRLLVAWAAIAATTAGHHVTTIFGSVFFAAPVVVAVLVDAWRRRLSDEPSRVGGFAAGIRRAIPELARLAVFGIGAAILLAIVILPYWRWSSSDPITQITIPHASRDSYLRDLNAGLVFWLIPWGLLLLALPVALYRGLTSRRWPLAASLALLTLLGTGGTTPIPRIVLGPAYEILTLDRFTFWATIAALPFAGELVASLRRGFAGRWLRLQFGSFGWKAICAALATLYLALTIFTVNLTHFRRFQPAEVDMRPVLEFIDKDQHWRWRYLALGFGDQIAWLSAQTNALTPDGDYHSARRLPELTSSSLERLEGAKYSGLPGIGSLQQFLAIPEKYNLKFVFSNDEFYDPLLFFSGWHRVSRLENGIVVWQRDDVDPLPTQLPEREATALDRFIWGVLPIGSVLVALLLLSSAFWLEPAARLASRLGVRRPTVRWPGRDRIAHIPAGLDEFLRKRAGPASSAERPPLWSRIRDRVPPPSLPDRRSRSLNAGLAALVILACLGASGYLPLRPEPGPEAVVDAYYNDLDFRRFDDAYARLDPVTRPELAVYLRRLSTADSGLLASYARLDSISTEIAAQSGGSAIVSADTEWITALGAHRSVEPVNLQRRDGRWYIVLPDVTDVPPTDELVVDPDLDFHAQGRRDDTTETTDPADILDRPDLDILSAALVERNGIRSVVGELVNTDVYPADITLTAVVFDKNGAELTRYNAQTVMMHTILPKERTPFRIDFEGVAGGLNADNRSPIDFQPGARYPVDPRIWDEAASFQLIAKAVVTPYDLDRDLSAQGLELSGSSDARELSGTLVNTGIEEAVIPHLLVTYYDASGKVAWVDELFLENSIRSQRSRDFTMPVTDPAEIAHVFELGGLLVNGLVETVPAQALPPDAIAASGGYAAYRVSINSFTRPAV